MSKGLRSGRWVARRGSSLCIQVSGEKIIGTYSTTHGRPNKDELFPVSGLVNEKLIGFSVGFNNKADNYFSLTSWTGIYEYKEDGITKQMRESIRAVWHHARMFEDDKHSIPIKDWCVFHVGSSEFFWDGELSEEEEEFSIKEITAC